MKLQDFKALLKRYPVLLSVADAEDRLLTASFFSEDANLRHIQRLIEQKMDARETDLKKVCFDEIFESTNTSDKRDEWFVVVSVGEVDPWIYTLDRDQSLRTLVQVIERYHAGLPHILEFLCVMRRRIKYDAPGLRQARNVVIDIYALPQGWGSRSIPATNVIRMTPHMHPAKRLESLFRIPTSRRRPSFRNFG